MCVPLAQIHTTGRIAAPPLLMPPRNRNFGVNRAGINRFFVDVNRSLAALSFMQRGWLPLA
jgi:hypothetical protein